MVLTPVAIPPVKLTTKQLVSLVGQKVLLGRLHKVIYGGCSGEQGCYERTAPSTKLTKQGRANQIIRHHPCRSHKVYHKPLRLVSVTSESHA